MLNAGKLHSLNPIHIHSYTLTAHTHRSPHHLPRLPTPSRFSSLAAAARSHSRYTSTVLPPQSPPQQSELEPAISSHYTATVGSLSSSSLLQLSQWNLTHRHIFVLNVVACAVAVSATWLFLSAIPTLLAFKRAAESLAKLMDVTREELPDTMAAIRLSGMEISDLTMELSDLGQEITQGVRSSTRAVRVAEERLRGVASMASSASLQRVSSPKSELQGLAIAKSAREMKEGIVKGRAIFQMFLSLARFSKMALNYFANLTRR